MRLLKADEGVSETLGFVLIALILTMVMAMVLVIGYPIYQESIDGGHMQNMQEGFYLLSSNINTVALYGSPIQSSELKLYGGTLSMHSDGYIKIYYRVGANWAQDPISVSPNQIMEYSLHNQRVAYILGGVFKKDGDDPVMLKDPFAYEYTNGNNPTVVIPLIYYTSPDTNLMENDVANSGKDLARVVIRSPFYLKSMNTISYDKASVIPGVTEIKIESTGEYNDALTRYFKDTLFANQPGCTPTTGTDPVTGASFVDKIYDVNDAGVATGATTTLQVPYCVISVSIN